MKSIELFAGVGGLGMGIQKAGFKPLMVLEKDLDCCKTIHNNQLSGVQEVIGWPIVNKNIKGLSFRNFEDKVDFLSGGPPCQPFSQGGKHLANLDERNLFPDLIRAIREIRPKAFLFENVRGLTRKSFSNYFEYIRLQLMFPEFKIDENERWEKHFSRLEDIHTSGKIYGLHYNVLMQVINAADYGIPQKRERVFFVGFRSELGINWHFPMPTHSREALIHSQIHKDYWDRHKIHFKDQIPLVKLNSKGYTLDFEPNTLPWRTVRDVISDLPEPFTEINGNIIKNHEFRHGARSYSGHTGSPIDEPAKTLKAGTHGVSGGENMIRFPNGDIRYFTVRESARLQCFPDNYIFHSSWGKSMYQLGNAVPVELAYLLGKSIKTCLINQSSTLTKI